MFTSGSLYIDETLNYSDSDSVEISCIANYEIDFNDNFDFKLQNILRNGIPVEELDGDELTDIEMRVERCLNDLVDTLNEK